MKKIVLIALAMSTLACTSALAQCCNRLGRFVDRSSCCEQTTDCCATPDSCDPCGRSRCRLFDCNLGFSFGGCGCRGLFPLFGGDNGCCDSGCGDCAAPAADACCDRGSLFGHHQRGCGRRNACGNEEACCDSDPCGRAGRGCGLFSGRGCGLFGGCGNDCGCETNACCDTVSPGLLQRHGHGCGLFSRGCGNGCGNDCGCETDPCGDSGRGCGLFSGHRHGGCGLFGRRSYEDCCDSCCNGSVGTPTEAQPVPSTEGQPAVEPQPQAQPAAEGSQTRMVPIVDPNAFRAPTTRFTTGRIK